MKSINSTKKKRNTPATDKREMTEKKPSNLSDRLRKLGLLLAAISSTVLTLPVSLPAVITTITTILGGLGSLAIAISRIFDEKTPSPGTPTETAMHVPEGKIDYNVDKKAVA
ncbi:MAG: hypothetical protein EON98_04460 [Chitinophagaceae bacterium]|nr:MAG: hypothetical protein EON98_04460 [Chitinophagaceae bacterium]